MNRPGEFMSTEMAEQPDVLAQLVSRWEQDIALIQQLVQPELAGVAFVARGSSDNVAQVGRYAVELFAGVPVVLAAPSLITRYAADLHYRDYLVVALSQSGATPEISTVATALCGPGSRTLAVTNGADSALARGCDAAVLLGAGPERAVPATKTVTASMLAVLAVATAVARTRGRPDPVSAAELAAVPPAIEQLLATPDQTLAIAQRWAGRSRLQLVGRGIAYGAVLEAALKVKETAGVFAQGISAADLLHGPIAALDEQVPVVVVDTGGPGSGELSALVTRLRATSSDVATCAAGPAADISLPPGLPEVLQTLTVTVRGQQLAYDWALAAGRDPDRPVGLSKVTATS